MVKTDFSSSINRRQLLGTGAAVTASAILPDVKLANSAATLRTLSSAKRRMEPYLRIFPLQRLGGLQRSPAETKFAVKQICPYSRQRGNCVE